MNENAKILIVEDIPEWAKHLETEYRRLFREELNIANVTIEIADDGPKALELVEAAAQAPYDLVSLDIHLPPKDSKSVVVVDGLRVLEEIHKQRAAWMVAILTGAETDNKLAKSLGEDRARVIQEQLRAKARETFPPERLMIVEKPKVKPGDARANAKDIGLLNHRLQQVVLVYDQLNHSRNVMREVTLPCQIGMVKLKDETLIPAGGKEEKAAKKDGTLAMNGKRREDTIWVASKTTVWQVRFDCGEILTIPPVEGFVVVQALLRWPYEEMSPGIVAALATGGILSPSVGSNLTASATTSSSADETDEESDNTDEETDPDFDEAEEDDAENDGNEADARRSREVLGSGGSVVTETWNTTEQESFAAMQKQLRKHNSRIQQLEEELSEDGLTNAKKRELADLQKEVTELEAALGKTRRGPDTKEGGTIRTALTRVKAHLREQGLVSLAEHLDSCIKPQRGKWGYYPSRVMNWQT